MERIARFKPIKQPRISEEVKEQLKQSILSGYFKAGDKLPSERDLSEEFQVSRVAIREALRGLENSGFVMTRQGPAGGAYVTDLTFEHLATAFLDLFMAEKISIPELHQVRYLVEPEVARLAALHVTPDFSARLIDALNTESLPVTSLSEDWDRKTKVHFMLSEMCGNRFFEALVRSALGLTRKVVEAADPEPPFIHPAGMHRPIVDAVLAGDAESAAASMKQHTIEFGQTLTEMEQVYRERQRSKIRIQR
jgi:GntR family transcriptional regulator, transcriptional repressor for pyruvate dehydrogenase complex